MFCECISIISLPDISSWNVSNVEDMSSLFYNCKSLTTIPDISKWNLVNIDDISYMFYGCANLVSLPDLSKWKKVKYGRHIVTNCFSLIEFYPPKIYGI